MTNYKQAHKPTTTIEEIVADFSEKFLSSSLYLDPEYKKYVNNHNEYVEFREAPGHLDLAPKVADWLTQTLKDYGDVIRAEERLKQQIFNDVYHGDGTGGNHDKT